MKRVSLLLVFVTLLSACSMTLNEFLGIQSTATPVPTFLTNTPTDAPTFTPTVPTPTFTSTPTLVGQIAKTPTPLSTPTLLVFTPLNVTPLPTSTSIVLATQVPIPGFVSISTSSDVFYKGRKCLPTSVKITAQVADPVNTAFVLLFVRFKSKQTGTASEWTDSIAMQASGIPGIFVHDLVPTEMKATDLFENAWVQYQLVATDAHAHQLGKTDIFSERLTLLECVPTPVPLVSATPTVTVAVP
jgi:hypothetical protein